MAEKQVRVMLWSVPRSVSTAFVVCMSNLNDVQIMNEPYIAAYLMGPDIKDKPEYILELMENMNKITSELEVNCNEAWESENFTYSAAKDNLEADYTDKKVIFAKDMSYAIADKLNMLPHGYRHAFLIRNPGKVFPSWKNLLNKFNEGEEVMLEVGKNNVIPEDYGFGESLQLYEHLKKTGIEPNPFIIDSDDLLENPESILRQFCAFAGIQYTDKLLSWDGGHDVTMDWKMSKEMLQWNRVGNFHKHAFESKSFGTSTPAPSRSELSKDVIHCIDASLPYYNKLYKLRAKIK
ncbi:uncharacterized protein [Antedon mediterranea]|uniref:uncharacterized protein n=1 Tax=Antedon mediterranea TaxID=105859 RepID=UPI003AF480E2